MSFCKETIFHSILWKGVIKFSPHSKGWELSSTSWRGEYLHLEFLCKGDFSPLPNLFMLIQSFIYIGMDLSTLISIVGHNSILLYFFAQNVSALAIGTLSG